jgi:NADH:ubiquinone oxidoreductase subunit E
MRHVAGILDMTAAEVEDVATYYVMFFKERVGKYVLQVCRTLSCALNGAERVTEALSEKLGINVGETDPSGTFTLLEFECLGACDRAPIVMINNEHWHERVRPEDAGKLIDAIRTKGEAAFTGCHLNVEKGRSR